MHQFAFLIQCPHCNNNLKQEILKRFQPKKLDLWNKASHPWKPKKVVLVSIENET